MMEFDEIIRPKETFEEMRQRFSSFFISPHTLRNLWSYCYLLRRLLRIIAVHDPTRIVNSTCAAAVGTELKRGNFYLLE